MPCILFDADVLFSLCYSKNPLSGAKRILLFGYREKYHFVTSYIIINEVRRNLINCKDNKESLIKLKDILIDFNFQIVQRIRESLITEYTGIIHAKDRHVLAAAIQAKADYLLTFNKKHFLTAGFRKLNLSLQIMNPKDFIKQVIFSYLQGGFIPHKP